MICPLLHYLFILPRSFAFHEAFLLLSAANLISPILHPLCFRLHSSIPIPPISISTQFHHLGLFFIWSFLQQGSTPMPMATVPLNKIERAHQMYREGLYVEALRFYTEALSMAKTKSQRIALHSNRAACHLKLHDFNKV